MKKRNLILPLKDFKLNLTPVAFKISYRNLT